MFVNLREKELRTWADRLLKCNDMLRVLIVVTHGAGMHIQGKIAA